MLLANNADFEFIISKIIEGEYPTLHSCRNNDDFNIVATCVGDSYDYYINASQYSILKQTLEALGIEVEEEFPEVIPPNDTSKVVAMHTSRFSGALWYEEVKKKVITLAGVGGIGSFVSFLLSRIDVSQIYLYDDDIVEDANLSGQLFSENQIGQYKVCAAATTASSYAKYNKVFALTNRWDESCVASDIMICGFDNMTARKVFFNSWLKRIGSLDPAERSNCLFIDGRLNLEHLQVLCITGNDTYNIKRYKEEFLFNDYEVSDPVCSMKQTTFMANMIGSIIVNLFVNFCTYTLPEEQQPLMSRDLPFFTEYNSELMFFKTER